MAKALYFSGTTKLSSVTTMSNSVFSAIGGARSKHNYSDSFSRLVGVGEIDGLPVTLPVSRVIFRKANPSNHKCDSRCLNATGHNCECSCGGKFHGAGSQS